MNSQNNGYEIDLGQEHVTIQRRYEALGALSDLFIAIWFLIGSIFFLNNSLVESGTWLFIVGSSQLLIKPVIKLSSLIHVSRVYRAKNELSPAQD
ncbi:YrhK family protein [Vibrio sp. PP-XX7]